jgi:hypothetical protein
MMHRGWRRLRGAEVVLHLKTGKSIAGTVWDERAGILVLRGGRLLDRSEQGTPVAHDLDGEVVVERADVEFAQHVVPIRAVS